MAGLEPGEQLQGAFGIGVSGFRDQEKMQALAGNTEQAREFRFVAARAEGRDDGVGEFVPERSAGPHAERFVAEAGAALALDFADVGGGGVRRGDQASGERDEAVELSKVRLNHEQTLRERRRCGKSSIK